jgi:D-3-phosphoglycerate dehydrogenase
MAKVLVTARSAAASREGRQVLESAGHEVVIHVADKVWPAAEMARAVRGVEAVIVGLDEVGEEVLAAGAPALKIVARNGAGFNNVDIAAAERWGIHVTIAPGANSVSVAELVFGLMLSLARRIPQQNATVRQGSWKRVLGSELSGKTLGVLGTGHIGGEVIKRAHAFDMSIVASDVAPRRDLCDLYGVVYADIAGVMRQADVLTLHLPAVAETRGLINAATLATMKPGVMIINTARGELVDEGDLCAALKSGQIGGYGADAFLHEPMPADSPLLQLDNVVATAHCGAYTAESVARCSVMAAEEVVRVLAGQPPRHAVTGRGR